MVETPPLLKTIRDAEDIAMQTMQDIGLNIERMYVRNIIETKSDDNLGVAGTTKNKDVLITPNPEVNCISLGLVEQTNGYIQLGDYQAIISGNVPFSLLDKADYIVYQNMLWKIIRIDGKPSENLPIQWKILMRRHVEG